MISRFNKLLPRSGGRPVPAQRTGGRLSAPSDATAAVVGGGLAGLAAAAVLAERGVKVTVFEKEAGLGGRLGAWQDQLQDGTPFEMERGFHGFFRQYYNLRNLLRRFDPSLSFLTPLSDYPLLGPNGASETFENLPKTPPFNLLELVRRSPYLPLKELKDVAFWPALAMMSYDEETTYRRYDQVSAAEYLDSLNFTDQARRMLFDVFSHSFFNPEARYSAAELLMNFHFYFLGNPEGLVFDVCNDPFGMAVLRPLQGYLERIGVEFECGVEVASVISKNDGVVVERSNGACFSADAAVLALHVPGLKNLVSASSTLGAERLPDSRRGAPGLREKVESLEVTDPFFVHRLWFDRPVERQRSAFAGTSGVGLLDNISVYERFEDESRRWADTRGGSVVELHAYAVPPERSEESVREELLNTLYDLYPETRGATILEERSFMKQDCPAFEPGSYALRPTVQCAGPRVALAGDYMKAPVPTALMERAATTGMLAANHLLGNWDVREETVYSIPPRGILASFSKFAEGRGLAPAA